MPNATGFGVTVNVGTTTFPVSVTVALVAGAATTTLSVAFFVSGLAAVGENLTVMVQVPFTGQVPMQVVVCVNWFGFCPVRVTLVMVNGAVPVLVTVTVWGRSARSGAC